MNLFPSNSMALPHKTRALDVARIDLEQTPGGWKWRTCVNLSDRGYGRPLADAEDTREDAMDMAGKQIRAFTDDPAVISWLHTIGA